LKGLKRDASFINLFLVHKRSIVNLEIALNQIKPNFVDDEKGLKTDLSFAYQIRFGYLSFLCF